MGQPLFTYYASAERSEPAELARQRQSVSDPRVLGTLLDDLPSMVLILNSHRQVVYANHTALEAVSAPDLTSVLGQRPGEMFHCKRATETASGCGTTPFCQYCGAVNAILVSQEGRRATHECRITIEQGGSEEALDLRVFTRPVEVDREPFTCFAIVDIADEKRRQFLESTFLHDLLNTASGLNAFAHLVGEIGLEAKRQRTALGKITTLAENLVDEINAYQRLVEAEHGHLQLHIQMLDSLQLLRQVSNAYDRPDLLNGCTLRIAEESAAVQFVGDPVLLGRVLGNMLKNALEASLYGETIALGCRRDDGEVAFWVSNRSYMPEAVRLQVFNRSFSTKAPGRGLGTYGMKYLSERYLGGKVSFTSTEAEGTTFTARYPLSIRARAAFQS